MHTYTHNLHTPIKLMDINNMNHKGNRVGLSNCGLRTNADCQIQTDSALYSFEELNYIKSYQKAEIFFKMEPT